MVITPYYSTQHLLIHQHEIRMAFMRSSVRSRSAPPIITVGYVTSKYSSYKLGTVLATVGYSFLIQNDTSYSYRSFSEDIFRVYEIIPGNHIQLFLIQIKIYIQIKPIETKSII